MRFSDIILGLLIFLLVGWTLLIAVEQRGLQVSFNALELEQESEAIIVSPPSCNQLQGYRIVERRNLREEEYLTTVGFNSDTNQPYFCFYQSG